MPKDLNDMLRDAIMATPDPDAKPKPLSRHDFMKIHAFLGAKPDTPLYELDPQKLVTILAVIDLMEHFMEGYPETFPEE